MPSTRVDYSAVHEALKLEKSEPSSFDEIISTPYGLSILEIQGELNLPTSLSQEQIDKNPEGDYVSNFAKVDDIYYAVKFGKLDFDPKDSTKVTLFIGKSQRLIGSMVNLNPPLGVMRIPHNEGNDEEISEDIKIVDIIKKKIIFKHRPLPIM